MQSIRKTLESIKSKLRSDSDLSVRKSNKQLTCLPEIGSIVDLSKSVAISRSLEDILSAKREGEGGEIITAPNTAVADCSSHHDGAVVHQHVMKEAIPTLFLKVSHMISDPSEAPLVYICRDKTGRPTALTVFNANARAVKESDVISIPHPTIQHCHYTLPSNVHSLSSVTTTNAKQKTGSRSVDVVVQPNNNNNPTTTATSTASNDNNNSATPTPTPTIVVTYDYDNVVVHNLSTILVNNKSISLDKYTTPQLTTTTFS
jgi:hypothetical protein